MPMILHFFQKIASARSQNKLLISIFRYLYEITADYGYCWGHRVDASPTNPSRTGRFSPDCKLIAAGLNEVETAATGEVE